MKSDKEEVRDLLDKLPDTAAAASLAEFAERGQIVPEFADPSIRELLVQSYRLVYRVSEKSELILALIHGAQRAWRV